MTAGDYVDGILAHRAVNVLSMSALLFALGVLFYGMYGYGGAFLVIAPIAAAVGWLFGNAYGKRKQIRDIARRRAGHYE